MTPDVVLELMKQINTLRAEMDILKAKRARDGYHIETLQRDLAKLQRDNDYMHRCDNKRISDEARATVNLVQDVHMQICHIRDNNNQLAAFENELRHVIPDVDYRAPERIRTVNERIRANAEKWLKRKQ